MRKEEKCSLIALPVSGQEVANVLRRVGRGETIAKLVDPRCTWEWVYAGNVAFEIEGYRLGLCGFSGDTRRSHRRF